MHHNCRVTHHNQPESRFYCSSAVYNMEAEPWLVTIPNKVFFEDNE